MYKIVVICFFLLSSPPVFSLNFSSLFAYSLFSVLLICCAHFTCLACILCCFSFSFFLFLSVYSLSWILCSPCLLFSHFFLRPLSCRVIADGTTDIQFVGLVLSLSKGHLAGEVKRDSGREKTEREVGKE